MILSEKRIVVKNSSERPPKKMISATCSKTALFLFTPLIDRNDKIQLAINKTMAITVISSMMVVSAFLSSFNEVSTIKQMPSKLDDAFNIWGDFSFGCFTVLFLQIRKLDFAQISLTHPEKSVIELLFNEIPFGGIC